MKIPLGSSLPVILLLILTALIKNRDVPRLNNECLAITHGISLLLGTSAMIVAFVGVMYLVHAFRLKKKMPLALVRLPRMA